VDSQGKTASLKIEPLSDATCKGVFVHLGDWGTSGKTNLVKLDARKGGDLRIAINPI
jgi:hypothetical protein